MGPFTHVKNTSKLSSSWTQVPVQGVPLRHLDTTSVQNLWMDRENFLNVGTNDRRRPKILK